MQLLKKILLALHARFKATSTTFRVILVAGGIAGGLLLGELLEPAHEHNVQSEEAKAFEAEPSRWTNNEVNINAFMSALVADEIAAIGVVKDRPGLILFTRQDGDKASTLIPGCTPLSCAGTVFQSITEQAVAADIPFVSIDIDTRTLGERTGDALRPFIPLTGLVVVLAILMVVAHRMQNRSGDAAVLAERPHTGFDDVVGNAEAKAAFGRVSAFIRNPQAYEAIGARAPHGVLLVGPPGTGKTMMARALAGETGASFIAVDGSYFTSMFYGAGINKVKNLFAMARKNAPCVLFIDEIDGIGRRSTGAEMRGGEAEGNRIINRVLVEMDGFTGLDNVVVVAATNHENNLDPALLRAGRFDTTVRLALPSLPERQALFVRYLRRVRHNLNIDCVRLARVTAGSSPADIANIVNKAASRAAEDGAFEVSFEHLTAAIEAHLLGGEPLANGHLMTEATRWRVAIHEAGHALVGHRAGAGVIERVTIEPRGQALGVTHMTRETEDPLYGEDEMTARLAMLLGGREAELLVFGNTSSGASDDLKRATELAVQMVGTLGFSKTFGPLSINGVPAELMGPDTQAALLAEARAMLESAQKRCRDLLDVVALERLAQALLTRDVVAGDELLVLLEASSSAGPDNADSGNQPQLGYEDSCGENTEEPASSNAS